MRAPLLFPQGELMELTQGQRAALLDGARAQ